MEPVDRLLVDTHVLLWWWAEPARLTLRVRDLIRDRRVEVLVSAACAWEIATKYRIGKLPSGGRIAREWSDRLAVDGFVPLSVTPEHALRAGMMPGDHRDPFDRMLAAQSMIESIPIASRDEALSELGARRVWE